MSDIESKPEDRVLFVINDNTIHGSTRFQKYAFLLYMQYKTELKKLKDRYSELGFYKDWKPYHYGPYSEQLKEDITKCQKANLLKCVEAKDKKYHDYFLTIKGRVRWRTFLNHNNDEIKNINEKIKQLQSKNFYELLRQIYSAYPEYTVNSQIKNELDG